MFSSLYITLGENEQQMKQAKEDEDNEVYKYLKESSSVQPVYVHCIQSSAYIGQWWSVLTS